MFLIATDDPDDQVITVQCEPRAGPRVAAVLPAVEDDSLVMLQPVVPTSIALAINALLWGWWSLRLAHPDTSLDEATVRRPYEAIVGLAAPDHPFPTKEQPCPRQCEPSG